MKRLVQGARAPGLAPRMVVDLALAVQVAVGLALAEILALLALHLEKVERWCQGIPPSWPTTSASVRLFQQLVSLLLLDLLRLLFSFSNRMLAHRLRTGNVRIGLMSRR